MGATEMNADYYQARSQQQQPLPQISREEFKDLAAIAARFANDFATTTSMDSALFGKAKAFFESPEVQEWIRSGEEEGSRGMLRGEPAMSIETDDLGLGKEDEGEEEGQTQVESQDDEEGSGTGDEEEGDEQSDEDIEEEVSSSDSDSVE
ncbi:MAG: hypothetical protein M1831_000982 [Alyxoria varia]|nr:MAG: hypothetical protein M1831_000982 [Alyxoria varia]